MAVELSYVKEPVKTAAAELGMDPGRISKWLQHYNGNAAVGEKLGLTAEQAEIIRLQKELKEAQLERDILEPIMLYPPAKLLAVGFGLESKGEIYSTVASTLRHPAKRNCR